MAPQPSSDPRPDGTGAPVEVSCREVVGCLDLHLDGELPPEKRRSVEMHLECCPDCARYLQSYRATIDLARAAFRAPAGGGEAEPEVPVALLEALLGGPADGRM